MVAWPGFRPSHRRSLVRCNFDFSEAGFCTTTDSRMEESEDRTGTSISAVDFFVNRPRRICSESDRRFDGCCAEGRMCAADEARFSERTLFLVEARGSLVRLFVLSRSGTSTSWRQLSDIARFWKLLGPGRMESSVSVRGSTTGRELARSGFTITDLLACRDCSRWKCRVAWGVMQIVFSSES